MMTCKQKRQIQKSQEWMGKGIFTHNTDENYGNTDETHDNINDNCNTNGKLRKHMPTPMKTTQRSIAIKQKMRPIWVNLMTSQEFGVGIQSQLPAIQQITQTLEESDTHENNNDFGIKQELNMNCLSIHPA